MQPQDPMQQDANQDARQEQQEDLGNRIDLGISRSALSLARYIDRLPLGDYSLELIKESDGWSVEVNAMSTLSVMNIPKHRGG